MKKINTLLPNLFVLCFMVGCSKSEDIVLVEPLNTPTVGSPSSQSSEISCRNPYGIIAVSDRPVKGKGTTQSPSKTQQSMAQD